MAVKRTYRLNLKNYGNLPAIMLSQYDEGYALEFEIRDGMEAAGDLSGYTVTLKGTRYDTLSYSFTGTISTNVLTFVIDTTMTACAGKGTAEIVITGSNNVVFATFNMPVFVEKAAVPDGTIDADVERAQEIAEQIQQIVDTAAEQTTSEAERIVADLEEDVSELKSGFNDLYNTAYVTDSASGGVAHFVDGADNVPLKSLKVAIEPVQGGSGDPSPDNVRPITGWDAVKIYHSGENTEDATEYDISLSSAGTVYGGTLDVSSGELVINKKMVTFDGSTTFNPIASYNNIFYTNITDNVENETVDILTNMGFTPTDFSYSHMIASAPSISLHNTNQKRLYICTEHTSVDALKTWLASNPLQVVYPLATPITYNLTPIEVKSLLGVNNIWSNAGDVEVEYRADTKLYIDKKLGV